MAEVFISYARANEDVAKRVASGLKASGFEAWWDEQLPAHRAYTDIIEQRLQSASAVVVLWSKEAAQSQWVRAEADFARNGKKLVQAQLDDTLPPLPFNQIQCADLRGWRGNRRHRGWSKLVDGVSAVVSGSPQQEAEPSSTVTQQGMNRRLALAGIAILLLIAAVAALFLPQLLGTGEEEPPRVAVLPFESVGGGDKALAAGIWEDTRHALSRNPQLIVLGPNTSEELAEKGSSAARKAADYLVEASVRTAPNRVRVSTSLVRSKDGAQIWSQTFDRKLDDVFALQTEIAQQIEGRIRGRLARGGGIKPENIATTGEVYALYSSARATVRGRDMARFEEALGQLEKVVAMDPNFAPGWATLSVVASFGITPRVPRDDQERQAQEKVVAQRNRHMDQAEAYARRAIALAPNLAAAHAALGFALGQRGPTAQAALRQAVALDPNDVEAMNWLANSMDPQKQVSERLKLYSRIVEIEPLWWPAILNKLHILLNSGDYAAAERERQRLERLGSTVTAGLVGVAIENSKGDLSGAARIGIRAFNSVGPEEGTVLGYELGFLLLKLGYYDEVQANFDVPPPAPYLWRNDQRGLDMVEALDFTPKRFFAMSPMSDAAGRVYVLSGQSARLAELYRSAASSPAEFQSILGDDEMIIQAPTIAIALRQSGDPAAAEQLLAAAESTLRGSFKQRASPNMARGLEEAYLARIYSVQGRNSEALDYLMAAVRAGWIPDVPWFAADLAKEPAFMNLKRDARFESARQQIFDRITKERAELGPFRLTGPTPAH